MACVSGLTNGIYSYVDCCGNLQSGVSLGESICIDGAYSGSATGVYVATGVTCNQNCNTGAISYQFTVTGICDSTSGSTIITPFGGVLPYTIDNVIPGSISAQTGNGPFSFTGLTGGTYVFRINDSLGLQNNEVYINVFISECFTSTVTNTTTTTCGLNNGSISVSASSTNSPYTIILYSGGNLYDVQQTITLPYTFTNLGSGTYYATVFDYGSITANTPNTIIYSTTPVNFGFWKVNTSNCVINTGKLAVTGVTGTGPYTYLWNGGETTQLITGLTQGTYSCTVTDSLGCSTTISDTIGVALPLGLVGTSSVSPSCFGTDGSLTYTVSGGTSPYFYSANTGQVGYTLSNTFTLTNLGSGNYSIFVRDANFCGLNLTGYLNTQNGFTLSNLNVTNSTCSQNNGEISVSINGTGSQNYLYVLSAQTGGTVYSYFGTNQSFTQTGLNNATYDLLISGSGAACAYTTTATVNSQQKFTVSATTTGSTCGQPNGSVEVIVGTGYTGSITYVLDNIDTPLINDSVLPNGLSAQTFTGLVPGNYTISVVDNQGCAVSQNFSITTTPTVSFAINYTNCVGNTLGSASASIYGGTPPFTYLWSNGSTGSTVSNLSGGTYGLTVTDNNGCSETNYFNITCIGNLISAYQTYNLCENEFTTTVGAKRGISEMFFEGFMDATSGYTGCTISNADLTCSITINGSAYTQTFANITYIDDIPSDSLWLQTVESLLSNINGVGDFTIDELNNTIHIESNCSGDIDPIGNTEYKLELQIDYDATCTGSASTASTPTVVCCAPTISSAGPINTTGLFGIYFNLPCGPCLATTVEYSTNSGATWTTNTGLCALYRTISTTATTATTSTVYFRVNQTCNGVGVSDYSNVFIYTYPVAPTPTPTTTPTPTPVYYTWVSNNDAYYIGNSNGCYDPIGSLLLYTSTPTLSLGTIIYSDTLLTTPISISYLDCAGQGGPAGGACYKVIEPLIPSGTRYKIRPQGGSGIQWINICY